ncbi:conserved hypothetical protein [Sulfolobus islandicus Y.N.15.51]|jgi:hypothetical protein|uniref:Uncharacterized protein n=3 Tax=Saccharolobus TaxID=2100760 RepID=Q97XU7_SACS2|nr:Hypothetical protein SSO8478 [Saccharolobus solfataricus P2]ACP49481.1 conserved hypothetical protein [Sulfolobus islandicus Y.N.15.51]SAI85291.1 uncharacterised protein [Saccharolobus solfataricus]
MEFLSLLIFVSGIIVAFLTLYFSPDFGRVKPNKRSLSTIFLSIALTGIGLWLYSIDHSTYFCPNINAPQIHLVYFVEGMRSRHLCTLTYGHSQSQ